MVYLYPDYVILLHIVILFLEYITKHNEYTFNMALVIHVCDEKSIKYIHFAFITSFCSKCYILNKLSETAIIGIFVKV